MTTKPLSDKAIDHLQALSSQSKAALIPALVEASRAGDARANYATNMLFAPAGFRPAEVVPGVIHPNHCAEWIHEEISSGLDIDWIGHEKVCEGIKEDGECNCDYEQGQTLLGDWKRVDVYRIDWQTVPKGTKGAKRKRVYVEDKNKKGGDGYSATWYGGSYSSGDIIVSWSKWVYTGGRWCSQCNPGQASIPHGDESFAPATDGVACYILPPALHRCFACNHYEREVVYTPNDWGAVLCDVCCTRFGIDFAIEKRKESSV